MVYEEAMTLVRTVFLGSSLALACATSVVVGCGSDDANGPKDPPADSGTPPDASPPAMVYPDDDLAALLEPIRTKYDLPALGAAVFDSNGALALGVTGVRKIGSDVLATKSDRFHLGSDTKAMTATLIARAVEKNELEWTTTLAETYSGETVHAGYQPVTIEQLLAHRGGAPANVQPAIWSKMWETKTESQNTRRTAVVEMLKLGPTSEVGTYTYANAGYMMAGAALEHAGASWEDRLRAEVFTPLGMTECGFGPAETEGEIDQPLGHREQSGKLVPETGWSDNPRSLGPAGTANCSLLSWGNFLRAHLRGALGDTTYLSEGSWTKMHTAEQAKNPQDEQYALGWAIGTQPWTKGPAFAHEGSNTLNLASAWVAPGVDRVLVVVTNAANAKANDAVQEVNLELLRAYVK